MENESYAMKGGEGPNGYAQNSTWQRDAIEASKEMIHEAIAKNFDPRANVEPSSLIRIADFDCSTGPNTYLAMQTVIEAIELQFQSQGLVAQMPEFQVFFNDQVSNDFNTLFKNLPLSRNYFVAGVPGFFHGRLFLRKTLHFAHSSAALSFLSKIPKEITDRGSSAWNKGRIHHTNAPKEVVDAYANQHKADLESFLDARAQELVDNGIMLLQIPVACDVILESDIDFGEVLELLESCLLEMTNVGLVSEEKVESLNVPLFHSPVKNVKAIFERNGSFNIQRIELLQLKNNVTFPTVQHFILFSRAVVEELIEKHFGEGITDEVFNRFAKKVIELKDVKNLEKIKLDLLFVILKRKPSTM